MMVTKRDRQSGVSSHRNTTKGQKKGAHRLNRVFIQLIASAAIFLLVFVGGGLIPKQAFDVFGSVRQVITGDQSLVKSVQALGQAVSDEEDWPKAVREWCVDTFLPTGVAQNGDQDTGQLLDAASQYHSRMLPQMAQSAQQSDAVYQN